MFFVFFFLFCFFRLSPFSKTKTFGASCNGAPNTAAQTIFNAIGRIIGPLGRKFNELDKKHFSNGIFFKKTQNKNAQRSWTAR
jgi:hypothetical protein